MKNLIYLLCILLFVSCGADETKEAVTEEKTAPKERSIGFNTRLADLKWYLGTDAAIDVVKELDKLWSARNYESMRPLLADTAIFHFADGRLANSPDEFINFLSEDESNDTWTFNVAYSVDLNPEIGGEDVMAFFTGFSVNDGDTTKTYYSERYYIIQGKVIAWNQYTQKEKKE